MIASFEEWWETHGKPYEAKVIENGGTPWTQDDGKRDALARAGFTTQASEDIEVRRALWERRYTRPAPPDLPTITSLTEFNRRAA